MKSLLVLLVVAAVTASSQASLYDSIPSLSGIFCQLYLGEIPLCAVSSCKEIAQTRLGKSSTSFHWLKYGEKVSRFYCGNQFPVEEGWTRVANVSSASGCPTGLEQLTVGGRTLCRKTVDTGCSSVTFATGGVRYSRVCGRVYGYGKGSLDGFERHNYCPDCTLDQQYVDGVSITHGNPRQHIWSLGASGGPSYCPCYGDPTIPPAVGEDYFCDVETVNSYTLNDRLWDGEHCQAGSEACCNRANWFCKDLPDPTSDNIEFRLCTDQERRNEDVYIEHIEMYVQ